MKRFAVAVVLLLAVAGTVQGQYQGGVFNVGEVVELPDIGGMYWATFVHDGSQPSRVLQSYLETNPVLADMCQNRTRFKSRAAGDTFYVQRLQPRVGGPPLFMLQTPDGGVIFKCSGANVPSSSNELVAEVKEGIRRWKADGMPREGIQTYSPGMTGRLRPCPCPTPQPGPAPGPVQPIDPIPDTDPDEYTTEDGGVPGLAWILAAILGFILGPVFGYLRDRQE